LTRQLARCNCARCEAREEISPASRRSATAPSEISGSANQRSEATALLTAANARRLVAIATALAIALLFFLLVFLSLAFRGYADSCADAARHERPARELARSCN
jgi:hypothetical protein